MGIENLSFFPPRNSQSYRVLDFNYINQDKFNQLKTDFENLSGKINNFISYLNKKDFKGTKFQ